MENIDKTKSVIEALLMISGSGLTTEELKRAMPEADLKDIKKAIDLLKEDYGQKERAFNIADIAGRYRIVTKPEYMPWISNLYQKETDRLTGPSLETLAIVAYKQPATRAEVEAVRGVNVGGVLKTLLEKDLLKVKGRKDVVGRPLMYGTTEKFLEIFGLNSLNDLPALRDFSEEDLEYGKPKEVVEMEEESSEEHKSTSAQEAGEEERSKKQEVSSEELDARYEIQDTDSGSDMSDDPGTEEEQEAIEEQNDELPEAESRELKAESSEEEPESIMEAEESAEEHKSTSAQETEEEVEEKLNTQYSIPNTSEESNDEAEKTE